MAGRIPQTFIDDLLDRLDIVEVVDRRVPLKKSGKNFTACCPFHDEKTPSFSVNQEKQFYYCFGCGAGGNAIGFLMDYERMEFPRAVEALADAAGLEVPREAAAFQEQPQQKKNIYTILEKAADYYRQQLKQHPQKQKAVDYLKNRGLSGEICRDFDIGYAPPGWDNLLAHLGSNDEEKQLLIDGGMLIEKEEENKLYDRFRDRIIFPIRDNRGRVIAFGGRVLGDDKPKYLNSPETPVFHKSKELYGLYQSRKANRQLDRLLIVEGYMDVSRWPSTVLIGLRRRWVLPPVPTT
ncbi:DNA primase [Oceanicoccus sp. KOV_DT_Chl]|uniref:DNA primase n=1 Tax=Oceanicoccus sp. KOV_DT_Chl TaxID=1904639 RepID=UPI00350ECE86